MVCASHWCATGTGEVGIEVLRGPVVEKLLGLGFKVCAQSEATGPLPQSFLDVRCQVRCRDAEVLASA